MPNLPYRKSILYHLHIIDEKLDGREELSEYPCWLKMTPENRKKLGINKSTLFYMKKNIREGKNIKIYDKVIKKLN